jgi:hypothetical protein
VEDLLEGLLGGFEDEWGRVSPAFRGMEEKGGPLFDEVQSGDGELLGFGESFRVEGFEGEVGDGRFGGEFALRGEEHLLQGGREVFAIDDLQAEGIGLPALEGVAKDGNLAGKSGLQEKESGEKEAKKHHGPKACMAPRSVET